MCLALAGVLCYRYGMLPASTRITLSRICYVLLVPCLLLSAADGYRAELLQRWLVLPIACICHVMVGGLAAFACTRFVPLPEEEKAMAILGCAFHNCGTLPTLFVTAVAATSPLFSNDADALDRGISQVFFYGLPWNFLMFSVGTSAVRRGWGVEPELLQNDEAEQDAEERLGHTHLVATSLKDQDHDQDWSQEEHQERKARDGLHPSDSIDSISSLDSVAISEDSFYSFECGESSTELSPPKFERSVLVPVDSSEACVVKLAKGCSSVQHSYHDRYRAKFGCCACFVEAATLICKESLKTSKNVVRAGCGLVGEPPLVAQALALCIGCVPPLRCVKTIFPIIVI